jgi:hypothetical protein
VPAGHAKRGGGEFGQDQQPEILRVQAELARQALGHLPLHPGAVVLHVSEQGRLAHDQPAGGEEPLVPAGIESGRGRGQRLVQFAEDGAGQLTAGQRGQVGRPELGLGLDRRGLLGREEAEERALRDLRLRGLDVWNAAGLKTKA